MEQTECSLAVGVKNETIRDRAVRLFTYLKELTELRSEVKRDCEEYERVVWWAEIPKESECYCAFWDLGREGAYDDWIRVERPRRKRPPAPPPSLVPWLNEREVADSSIETPNLKESIIEEISDGAADSSGSPETVTRKLEEFPAITRQWEIYVEHQWWPWALEDRRVQTIQAIYNDLFAAYQTQERMGEAFETIVGIGLLKWKPPHGLAIRRHVVTAQVTIEFDSKSGAISVAPAAEGIRLALEQEMLEPQDRPLPEVQNQLQLGLAGISDEAWTGPELANILREYIHQLSSSATFETSIEPMDGNLETPEPRMSFAPALLVRKRTERSMVRIFQEIADQLTAGAAIPIGVEKLVAIRDDREIVPNGSDEPTGPIERELYFPLPANDAQRDIARILDSRQGVLVQGPPGTGKSHTIANLICHLLATGQRLLVTSHTARALRVLKGYFPPEIAPLCVSLLGDDAIALRELEESVQGILNKLNAWNPREADTKARQLEADLDAARRELAEAHFVLRRIRQSEIDQVDLEFQQYRGTPQGLARRLNGEAPAFDWLKINVSLNAEPVLKNQEFRELVSLIRQFNKEDDDATRKVMPEIANTAEPHTLESIFRRESELDERISKASRTDREIIDAMARASREMRSGLESALYDFICELNLLSEANDQWIDLVVGDVLLGKHLAWQELSALTKRTVEEIEGDFSRVARLGVSGLEGRDHAIVRADTEALRSHLANGKRIGFLAWNRPFLPKHVKVALYLASDVRIDGHVCDSISELDELLRYLRVASAFEYLKNCWSTCTVEPVAPREMLLSEYKRRIDLIQKAIGLREKIAAIKSQWNLIDKVHQIGWQDKNAIARLATVVDLAHAEAELNETRQALAGWSMSLKALQFDPNTHPVVSEMQGSIENRDANRYFRAHRELLHLHDLRTRRVRREALEARISDSFVLKTLWDQGADPAWDKRAETFEEAWDWCRANEWLKMFTDPTKQNANLQQIGLSQDKIRENLSALAALKAWDYVLSRLNDEQREHLMAWRLAIKKIGKGTGKYAAQYRKEARYHLDHCRSAIPAWVMPIYRVAESTKPAPNLFDVAIIDEASQSGPEALFLQYIARKIVVVGDDQQISPDSVGLDRESVNSLRERYIRDLPMWDALGVDNSFFDQAQIRFSGRVRLREHFRCMPEIIQFSNRLCYEAEPLIPLRQYGAGRLEPVLTKHIPDGYVKGTGDRIVNPPEAEAIADQIHKCINDPAYQGKRFGVICLQGNAQWNLIRDLLLERVGAQVLQDRGVVGGNAYAFQGDERDVIFLSMVAAPSDGRHIGVLSKDSDKRRFNVAASRARDQMWLFHSVALEDLSAHCFRRKLLEHCLHPGVQQESVAGIEISQLQRQAYEADRGTTRPPNPFDSWFEVDVFLKIVGRGYRVIPQFTLAGKRIDLVVEGMQGRLAVECDGDEWHGIAEWDNDVDRQRMLERCGLAFWRVRGSAFYRDQNSALAPLWILLENKGIHPKGWIKPFPPVDAETGKVTVSPIAEETVGDGLQMAENEMGSAMIAEEEQLIGSDSNSLPFPDILDPKPDLGLLEYRSWRPHPVLDPHSASLQELMEGLIEIVEVEGPIVCKRIYRLYNSAAGNSRLGSQITHLMNRAIYRAVRLGRLAQNDEKKKVGQINQVVWIPGTPEVLSRERGSRLLEELPDLEIRRVRELVMKREPGQDESTLVRKVAVAYGIR